METFAAVQEEARNAFSASRRSHDWEHTRRVLILAARLAAREGADLEIVRYAAVLHDIARGEEDLAGGGVDHAERGAELARQILTRHQFPAGKTEAVAHCIRAHRFRGRHEPKTLEARVLFDADKLDSIGAIGIGRAYLFAGEVGAKLHNPEADPERTRPYTEEDTAYREYRVKLCRIRDRMLTPEGRRLAAERQAFMEEFFRRLNREVAGEL